MIINNKKIGIGESCFIIAEAGVNHNGDPKRALSMVEAAAEAGVDAIKFQTFQTELLVAKDTRMANYQSKNTGVNESQFSMLKSLELPLEAYPDILDACERNNVIFVSTPFDLPSVEALSGLGVDVYKISSGELTNHQLLRKIAEKGKPVIVSTGMSTLEDVQQALQVLCDSGANDLMLLQCTSHYPVSPEDVNVRAMKQLETRFSLPVGFSDHTLGINVSMAAVALGACVIEKHFTLDNSLPGPDHLMSLSPDSLKNMVDGIRAVELALGDGKKKVAACESDILSVARKSIHYRENLRRGVTLSENNIIMLRPSSGVPPSRLEEFVGVILSRDVVAGEILDPNDFA